MPLHFLDTSALAKRYLAEQGSDWVAELLRSEPVSTSALTSVEFASVLARRVRDGSISAQNRAELLDAFSRDAERWIVIDLADEIIEAAARLITQAPISIPLRALDALQLACGRASLAIAGDVGNPAGSFVSADHRLLAAAQWAGLAVENPEDHA